MREFFRGLLQQAQNKIIDTVNFVSNISQNKPDISLLQNQPVS